jgi:3-oxoacyl-(acyl-carrier-protein) synthase
MRELKHVVCSGWGAITARGDATLHGESTLALGAQPSGAQPCAPTGVLENFALGNYLDSKKTYLDRCSALALAGSALALRDAGIAWPVEEERFGITLGTHFGCLETMKSFWDNAVQKGARLANPILFSHSYVNSPISLCAIEFGLKGYHTTFCAHEYSGLEAVCAAFDAIRLGHADAMLCGGVEAVTATRTLCAHEECSGEAAVFFVLENAESAIARGAASTRPVDEAWFADAAVQCEAARTAFGDCGGALGALALLQIAAASKI